MIDSSLRDAPLRLGWSLIEALTFAAAAVTVTATLPSGAPHLQIAPLVILMMSVTLIGRAAAKTRLRPVLARALALLASTLLALGWLGLSAPPGASRVALTALCVLALGVSARALLLGFHQPGRAPVMRSFLRGAVIFMALFGLLSLARISVDATPRAQLRALVLAYFVVGPVVVALAQQRELARARGVRAKVGASWLLAIVLPVGSALALAVLASVGTDGLREGLRLAMQGAGFAVSLTVRTASWVAYAGLMTLTYIAGLFPGSGSRRALPPRPPAALDGDEPLISTGPPPPLTVAQHDIASAVLLVTMVLFVALYVSKLVRAPAGSDDPFDADEERTSLWSWKLLARQARDLLRSLLSRARTAGLGDASRAPHRSPRAADSDLSDVRGVYRALLGRLALRGHRRTPETTPHELAARVTAADHERVHLDALTELYVEVRYGEHELPAGLMQARVHLHALTSATTASLETRAPTAQPEEDDHVRSRR